MAFFLVALGHRIQPFIQPHGGTVFLPPHHQKATCGGAGHGKWSNGSSCTAKLRVGAE